MVPERDHLDSHRSNRRAQKQEIVRPARRGARRGKSSGGVRVLLTLLSLAVVGGGAGGYYFYTEYETDLRQTQLRLGDLERRLALTGEDAEESAVAIMAEVERTIEQYDLLWANWRTNNQTLDDIRSEIARLELVNEGQDEVAVNNSQAISRGDEALLAQGVQLSTIVRELAVVSGDMAAMNSELSAILSLQSDIEGIRDSVNSGDSTVLGLVGRLESMEQAMESIDAYRLQTNDSLFRLQEYIEELQRTVNRPRGAQ